MLGPSLFLTTTKTLSEASTCFTESNQHFSKITQVQSLINSRFLNMELKVRAGKFDLLFLVPIL